MAGTDVRVCGMGEGSTLIGYIRVSTVEQGESGAGLLVPVRDRWRAG